MKIPEEFTIGNFTYKVKQLNSDDEMSGNLGDFCELSQEIRLAKNARIESDLIQLTEDKLFSVFLHELGHCFGNYYADNHTEELACAFSNFMFDFFKSIEE